MALLFSSRLLVGLGAAMRLMITRPDALMRALLRRGLANQIACFVVTTLRIVPTFQARAHAILDAQRSRGLETEGSLPECLRAFAPHWSAARRFMGTVFPSGRISAPPRPTRPGSSTTMAGRRPRKTHLA